MGTDNRGPPLQRVCYAMVVIALVSALLRFYVRLRIVRSFGVDDWFMLGGLVSFCLFVASSLLGVHFGAGRHILEILDDDRQHAIQCWWFCYLWYCLTMTATKVSIAHLLLRLVVRRLHSWIIYGVLILNIFSGIAFFFITLFQCSPVSEFWRRTGTGKCLGMDAVIIISYVYGTCGMICDFTCTLLPMWIIWGLNMDKRTKISLMPVMAMACVASAATVVRFVYCEDARDPDFLYATINIVIWSTVEQGLAVAAGSLATLRPLLRIVTHKFGLSVSARPSSLNGSENPDRFERRSKKHYGGRDGVNLHLESMNGYMVRGKDDKSWKTQGLPENGSEEELTAEYARKKPQVTAFRTGGK
ncbi:hypothetical protein EDB81DRAFT_735044 [Dactylonectria macrodidyma]|uniref:Rhodopsin domain-containing protein n=1 Tax=Dactylonectria macrodidyma TaxID=307937 RepID=A0A9P9I9I2_9HYPO|nr:hypothetical protein EDB81DRAFT_735044 [Dactylonectria macrodidyma]